MFRRLSLLALCLGAAVPTLSITEAAARERLVAPSDATKKPSDAKLSGTLNINTATSKQWQLLPGIGPSTADKVLAYRTKHPFANVEQVMRVKGIGRKTFTRIKPYLNTKGETTLKKQK